MPKGDRSAARRAGAFFRWRRALSRTDLSDGGAEAGLYLRNLRFAMVRMPGPEETLHSIFPAARHDVHVKMGHALAYTVIDGHEGSLCGQTRF